MANYNTFVVVDCRSRKPLLTTSSARKARKELQTGIRVEVWNGNQLVERIYESDKRRERDPLVPYVNAEKEYIRKKQKQAEERNAATKHRKGELNGKTAQRD